MPHLPQNLCLDYYLLRDFARAQVGMRGRKRKAKTKRG